MFESGLSWLMLALTVLSVAVILRASEQLKKDNPGGLTPWLLPLGIFVWGDGVILGSFWLIVALAIFLLKNWLFFWLIYTIFWLIRSLGEVIYWLLQQFSPITRDPPRNLWLSKISPGESVWYGYQLIWQCVFVVASVGLIFLLKIIWGS